jgi:hypothetical protein
MEQIDIADANKANKDKSESLKITLLNQEITRASLKPEFLSYFHEVSLFSNFTIANLDYAKIKYGETG